MQPSIGWGKSFTLPVAVQEQPDYQNDVEKKKQYGIALAKQTNQGLDAAFKAGCEVFPDNTNASLWVAHNWINDPVVVASRDLYADSVKTAVPVLDKEQFALKVLSFAEEKVEANGRIFYVNEAKDRLGFLRLYAEVKGYVGKTEINNNLAFTHNEMKVKLVKPDPVKEEKTIDHEEHRQIENVKPSPFKIKLVG